MDDAETTFSGSAFLILVAATWKGSATDRRRLEKKIIE